MELEFVLFTCALIIAIACIKYDIKDEIARIQDEISSIKYERSSIKKELSSIKDDTRSINYKIFESYYDAAELRDRITHMRKHYTSKFARMKKSRNYHKNNQGKSGAPNNDSRSFIERLNSELKHPR